MKRAYRVAYSDSASGKYIAMYLFKKLGIEKQLKDKSYMIPATPVGEVIAQGQYEIGFQQYSELLPIKGIQLVGLIPPELQKVTKYAAIITTASHHKKQAVAFIHYLASKPVASIIKDRGLEPINGDRLVNKTNY